MGRSVAFLRGINVGGRRATKDQLIAAFTGLGLESVDTFLASGNVLFDPGDGRVGEDDMATALEAELGYEVPTTVRTESDLVALDQAEPFSPDQLAAAKGKPQVILLFAPITAATRREVAALSTPQDLLVPADRAIHWLPADGVSGSGLDMADLAPAFGQNTVRTANTIRRLLPKL